MAQREEREEEEEKCVGRGRENEGVIGRRRGRARIRYHIYMTGVSERS